MGGGGGQYAGVAEQLASGLSFTFTKMQNHLWEAVTKTHFYIHRQFMACIFTELNEDPDTRQEFYRTIFEKMHLELCNIKTETFHQAEKNVELLKNLLDFEGAA